MNVLSDELIAFVSGPVSVLAAGRDGSLDPRLSRALSVRVGDDRASLTVYVATRAGAPLLEVAVPGAPLAVTTSHVPTLRTVQIKGTVLSTRPARDDERAAIEAQAGGFTDDLGAAGFALPVVRRLVTWPAVAVEMRIEGVFEQSPGPGAGRPMEAR